MSSHSDGRRYEPVADFPLKFLKSPLVPQYDAYGTHKTTDIIEKNKRSRQYEDHLIHSIRIIKIDGKDALTLSNDFIENNEYL